MFDKDLNSYLRAANTALPCGAARIAFARYVNEVAQDVLRNAPGADFAAVTEQLGPTPRQAAEDFMESQPPETLARWEAEGHRQKRTVILAVGLAIAALAAALAFFVVTKGILIVNTETTYTDLGEQQYTPEDLDELANQVIEQSKKEHENDENS